MVNEERPNIIDMIKKIRSRLTPDTLNKFIGREVATIVFWSS